MLLDTKEDEQKPEVLMFCAVEYQAYVSADIMPTVKYCASVEVRKLLIHKDCWTNLLKGGNNRSFTYHRDGTV